MAEDLEIVLRIDLVGQRQHTASSLWLILLLLVLLWCRRLQREVGYRYIGQVLLSLLHLETWYLLSIVNLLIRTWSLDTEVILLFDNCSILVWFWLSRLLSFPLLLRSFGSCSFCWLCVGLGRNWLVLWLLRCQLWHLTAADQQLDGVAVVHDY